MRYIVVDLEGSSRLHFERLSDARDWADRLNQKDPELLGELLIERYRASGDKAGESEWADDFLDSLKESIAPAPYFSVAGSGLIHDSAVSHEYALVMPSQVLGFTEGWSGTAGPMNSGLYRLHEGATDTHAQAQGETAAS